MAALNAALPKDEQTILALYLTAREAFEKWRADPNKVKILDVRTPEEFLVVSHRLENGRKHSGWPWTYNLTPDRMLPSRENHT